MSKKVLIVAAVPSMIGQFNMNNIYILQDLEYEVHIACNFKDVSIWPKDRIIEFIKLIKRHNVVYHQISFSRTPKDIKNIYKSLIEMDFLLKMEQFDFVHCHTPIAAAISRIICHKNEIKVIYTAHGFHFYDGAPLKNWLIFYPIEKWMSRYTDVLITINYEDYRRAKKRFKAKKTIYIPGVGVDIKKFSRGNADIGQKREELGLEENDIMLLSIGELSIRKNHGLVIQALEEIKNPKIHYFIAGIGELEERYKEMAQSWNIPGNVHFLGYRTDIPELCQAADLYILPSIQEGLPVALMEAVACRTPVICSNIRGNVDLVSSEGCLFEPGDVGSLVGCLENIIGSKGREQIALEMQESVDENYRKLYKYDLQNVQQYMNKTYKILGGGSLKFLKLAILRQELNEKYGVGHGDRILLSVGELNKNKNHRVVIEALGRLGKNSTAGHRLHYCIAGKGTLHDELMGLAQKMDVNLHLLGFRNDVPELLELADVFLLPSIREGLNVSLMEAMASGLPCIVSDIRGNRDLVENGKGGYLVSAEKVKEWAEVLSGLENLIRDDMGLFNRKKITFFSEKNVLNQMQKCYENANRA